MSNAMTLVEKWLSFIKDKTNDYTDQIVPLFDLSILLKEIFEHDSCPFLGLEVRINHFSIEYHSKIFGDLSDNARTIIDPFHQSDAVYQIRYVLKQKNIASGTWYISFVRFLTSIWLPDCRKHGALDFKQDRLRRLLPVALTEMFNRSPGGIYCVFADLDHFGDINKKIGAAEGDKAIQEVLGCFESVAIKKERAICTINGGDEYVLFIENKGDSSLLRTLNHLKKLISAPEYGEEKLKVGITFGVHELEDWSNSDEISDAVAKADRAFKIENSSGGLEKNRGVVAFYSDQQNEATPVNNLNIADFIRLGISLIRSRQFSDKPFSNSLLNYFSSITVDLCNENREIPLSQSIEEHMIWLGVKLTEAPDLKELIGNKHRNQKIYKGSLALAIAHGLLNAQDTSSLALRMNDEHLFSLIDLQEKINLWGDEINDSPSLVNYRIGARLEGERGIDHLSNCALISIGEHRDIEIQEDIFLPQDLFAGSVIVDERPIKGGGLPDFWQAAVAQLISIVTHNNIDKVIVYGDEDSAPNVANLLRCKSEFSIDDIAEQSASSRPESETCINLLGEDAVVVFCKKSLTRVIKTLYESMIDLDNTSIESRLQNNSNGFMRRPLDFSESQLPLIHGIKCQTAAMAYPAVLEELRSNNDEQMTTYDNAEKPLTEIIGFKLLIDKPFKDQIPDYWLNSSTEIEKYAQGVLIDKDGLIGSKLNENNQFTLFINHLAKYCDLSASDRTSTRRAIMIVSNQFDLEDMYPLGLVCVWVTPRYRNGRCKLDYCFVWRTVEALVGFPYSLFGSIQLARDILQKLNRKLGLIDSRSSNILEGTLTYVALSMHMKTDEYNKRIAKSIVDAASI